MNKGKKGASAPKPRNISRHRPGYFTEYMRVYRKRKKDAATAAKETP